MSDEHALARRVIAETLYGVNKCDAVDCEGCQEFYSDCMDAADSVLAALGLARLTVIDLGPALSPAELRARVFVPPKDGTA